MTVVETVERRIADMPAADEHHRRIPVAGQRGLEPDECFWIANEKAVRGKADINLTDDPPPDLVLEIEVSRSTLDRIGIYAVFGVPEIWRCDSERLIVCRLNNGAYEESETSGAFPHVRPAQLLEFIKQRLQLGEVALVKEFRQWVREQISRDWQ